ncbi:hypothetical protein IAT38_003376 [Cryptococcus sp. DSM 104549]
MLATAIWSGVFCLAVAVALAPEMVIAPLLVVLGYRPGHVVPGSAAASIQSARGTIRPGGLFAKAQSAASGGPRAESLGRRARAGALGLAFVAGVALDLQITNGVVCSQVAGLVKALFERLRR